MNGEYISTLFTSEFYEVISFGFACVIVSWFLGYSIGLILNLVKNIIKP